MIIEYDKSKGWDGFQKAILTAKDAVEHRRESSIRHCTMTAATLIGLISVFGEVPASNTLLRYLTVSSVLFLLLTVLAGVMYCFLRVRLDLQSLQTCVRQYQEGHGSFSGETSLPILGWLAGVFPWLLCLGILLLSASVVSALLFP